MNLDRGVDRLLGRLGGQELRHRRERRVVDALVVRVGGLMHEQSGGVRLRGDVGQAVGDGLVVFERFAERLALACVRSRQVDRGERHPDCERADAGSKQVERSHRDLEALAGVAEHVVVGDVDAIELQRADRVGREQLLGLAAEVLGGRRGLRTRSGLWSRALRSSRTRCRCRRRARLRSTASRRSGGSRPRPGTGSRSWRSPTRRIRRRARSRRTRRRRCRWPPPGSIRRPALAFPPGGSGMRPSPWSANAVSASVQWRARASRIRHSSIALTPRAVAALAGTSPPAAAPALRRANRRPRRPSVPRACTSGRLTRPGVPASAIGFSCCFARVCVSS